MFESIKKFINFIIDFLSPEDRKIKRWLKLNPQEALYCLPKPRTIAEPNIFALFDYRDDKARTLIRAIKYRANRAVIKRMAGYLYEEIMEFASDASLFEGGREIIIVPMPISAKRRTERGWSQCELLCAEIQKLCGREMSTRFDILKKIRDTKKQTDLARTERLLNVQNSMKAVGPLPPNSLFIVVDDVYTTGATFIEARRALKATGAKKIFGFFLAH
ncbi:MAG: hypothetical protein AAB861_03510 [Patescibacteria group bacterium]